MAKINLKPGDIMGPLPCIMATVSNGKEDNIITIAWTGIVNSIPPMTYISVRPTRYSHHILMENQEFVINIPGDDLLFATDHCGCKSGKDEDKFETMHLTKVKADKVSVPMIAECPINLECVVKDIKHLGSHDMFLAEIVAVHADDRFMDENGRLAMERMNLVGYLHGDYIGLSNKRLGTYGYSVMKPKTAKKRRQEGKPAGGKGPHFEKEK